MTGMALQGGMMVLPPPTEQKRRVGRRRVRCEKGMISSKRYLPSQLSTQAYNVESIIKVKFGCPCLTSHSAHRPRNSLLCKNKTPHATNSVLEDRAEKLHDEKTGRKRWRPEIDENERRASECVSESRESIDAIGGRKEGKGRREGGGWGAIICNASLPV